jgi:membrane protease YdiL (CAAX protease family)
LVGAAPGIGLYVVCLIASWVAVVPFSTGQPAQPRETMVSSASVSLSSVVSAALVLGVYYLRTRALFPVVFAHVLADIIPFV